MPGAVRVLHRAGGSGVRDGEQLRDREVSDEALSKLVRQVFPLLPHGIIDHLKLREPVYLKTAAYGHFGRPEFAWERVDATEELLAKA